jgi:hypothetical protein
MSIPSSIDVDIHGLLLTNALSLPVHRGEYIPSSDLQPYKQGYITWSYDTETTLIDSEGHSTLSDGKQVILFELDITVYADSNAKRKAAADAVLDVVQPMSGNKRTLLTSVLQGDTFFNFIIYRSTEQIYTTKTGQSTAEVAGLMMTFSCKASY